jgi:NADPH:quinone reductase-like Zn-dependent oxidoreductase
VRALIFDRNGEPAEVLGIQNLPDPAPGPGEVLVRVLISPVHASDLHIVRGRYGRQPSLPASPGVECVGVVEALGPNTFGPARGTRVVLIDVWGTWRELVVSPVERLVPVPDEVTNEDAAQTIVTPVTALVLTKYELDLKPGEWLVQTAAGSTVGRLILQLARIQSFRTINLVRRPAEVPEIVESGGDIAVSTEQNDWPAQLVKASGGRGPSKAIDCVAGRVGVELARVLAPGGRLVVFGALSSHRQTKREAFEMPLFAPGLIYGALTVRGWFLFHWLATTPLQQCVSVVRSVLDLMASRTLRLPSAVRYPLSQINVALQAAEAPAREGKPLIDFSLA